MAKGAGVWGLGPVFAAEWLARSRRWQGYALRSLFVLALLAGLAAAWLSAPRIGGRSTAQDLAAVGQSFFATLTALELSIVLLAAPAATAGAICQDKARGTLADVLVTDLSDAEVVLGKLGARLVPVLNLVACAVPVAALGALLGGIDPVALAGSFLIAASLAVLGCSLAMALSVHATKAQEVMTALFAIWAAWLLALPAYYSVVGLGRPPAWLELSNPFWLATARYTHPRETTLLEPAGFALACLAISGGLVALAVARLRPAYLRQAGRRPPKARTVADPGRRLARRWGRGPSLDANPVLWREWHRNRPSRWTRIVWAAYIAVSAAAGLVILANLSIYGPMSGPRVELPAVFSGAQATFGLLLISASAASALAEERSRGSLDVLLATPMSTRSIVFGKWWGVFRRTPWLAALPALIALASLPKDPDPRHLAVALMVPVVVVAQASALASLGLALATWIARVGRATTWTVAACVASVVGWPILGFRLDAILPGRTSKVHAEAIVCAGSPFWNVGHSTFVLRIGKDEALFRAAMIGVVAWSFLYGLIACGLYLATLLTFDRCLGRSPESARRPQVPPRVQRLGLENSIRGRSTGV